MSLNSAEQCEAAVTQVAALTAENARLRAEIQGRAEYLVVMEQDLAVARADLARLTGQRGALLEAARAWCDEPCQNTGRLLRAAVEACGD